MYTLAPALAAGNTVVVKPSEHASASVIETVRLAEQVGFPPGVINVVTGDGEAGAALVDHPGVASVAFTGSDATGTQIAARAAGRLAASTLELGGKSANIVFADADLEAAEAGILAGIFGAAGQTCVAGSRALVAAEIHDELLERLARARADDPPGRSDGRGHPDGPDREPAAPRPRGAHGRRGTRGRRRGRRRRRSRAGRRPAGRPLLPPDDPERRREHEPDRAGRGVRAGARR